MPIANYNENESLMGKPLLSLIFIDSDIGLNVFENQLLDDIDKIQNDSNPLKGMLMMINCIAVWKIDKLEQTSTIPCAREGSSIEFLMKVK